MKTIEVLPPYILTCTEKLIL